MSKEAGMIEVGLRCPKCKGRTAVHKTKSNPEKVRRKRRCLNPECGNIFGTVETIIFIEKSDLTTSPIGDSGT